MGDNKNSAANNVTINSPSEKDEPASSFRRLLALYAAPMTLAGAISGGSAYVGTGAAVENNTKIIEETKVSLKKISERLITLEVAKKESAIERRNFAKLIDEMRAYQTEQTKNVRKFYESPTSPFNLLIKSVNDLHQEMTAIRVELNLTRITRPSFRSKKPKE